MSSQFGPEAVFYINNVIWFLGVDIYHLYFTIALWTCDVPSIKEVPQRIVFYPLKPPKLEPRRPKFENNDTSNVSFSEAENPNMTEAVFEELFGCNATCEFQNGSIDKPWWKGKGGGKRKVTPQNKTRTREQEQEATKADQEQEATRAYNDQEQEATRADNEQETTRANKEQEATRADQELEAARTDKEQEQEKEQKHGEKGTEQGQEAARADQEQETTRAFREENPIRADNEQEQVATRAYDEQQDSFAKTNIKCPLTSALPTVSD